MLSRASRCGGAAVSGHTPGPWEARYEQMAYTVYADGQPGGLAIICCYPAEEERANALLVAAAPDMLEELTEIREWFRAEYSRDDSPKGMFVGTSVEKDVASIDRTIAQATGNE